MKPQERYSRLLQSKKLDDGRTVYKSNVLKDIIESTDDFIITAGAEDRADIIANNAFGDPDAWWRIIANKNFKGSLFFKPGQEVRIPKR